MIFPLGTYNYGNSSKSAEVSFTGRTIKLANEVKNLDKLTCPRCGGPIISPEKLINVYRSVCLPLKSVLNLDFFKRTQEMTNVWEVILSFAKKYPKQPLDKILEGEENHDIFRNAIEKMVAPDVDRSNRKEYEKYLRTFDSIEYMIRKSSRAKLRSSSVVVKKLKPLISYLKQVEKKVPYKADVQSRIGAFEELVYLSELYPKKRISEIVDDPCVKEYITIMNKGTEDGRKYKQKAYYEQIKELVMQKTGCTKAEAGKLINDIKALFMVSDVDIGVRVCKTKKYIRTFLAERKALTIYPKIEKILKEIPETLQNKYSILRDCCDRNNDSKIIDIIFKAYAGSTEHVFALSTGGGNYRSNVISMHKICNFRRANTSYKDYVKYYPAFPKNMCKQVKQVSDYIYQDKMDPNCRLYLYPPQIKDTLILASEGAINPLVADYCRKSIPKFEEKIRNLQRKISSMNHERDRYIRKLQRCETEQEKEEIRAKTNEVLDKQKVLITEIKNTRYYYNSLKGYLKKELNEHQELSDNL